MISHVVLFRPKPSMTAAQRADMVSALQRAIDGIPQIKRFTIGRRILLNRPGYETQMAEHYEYAAILEFESEAELRVYLDHPAHDELGKMLFTSAEAVLAYDFERQSPNEII
ncbi:MAG: Dabb family protein [Cyanobacteria bacterium]|nr:Dabb family protein [Cyanobacteriota bacterium]